jgi:phosphate transport system substrate-binding protein
MVYSLPGVPKLRLDAAAVANIYLGKITKWNDSAIVALNPGANLPDQSIVVVHRSDGSGTTYIFADYLCSVSPTWKSSVGKGTSVKWPVGLGGKGNEGVAGQVKQLPGSIGYVELAYALQNKMTYATLKNAAGNFVEGTLETTSIALASATIPDDFRFSIVNTSGDQAYPIAGASWVLVFKQQKDTEAAHKLIAFLRWAVTDGQKVSSELSYAPLPGALQQRIIKSLDTITFR